MDAQNYLPNYRYCKFYFDQVLVISKRFKREMPYKAGDDSELGRLKFVKGLSEIKPYRFAQNFEEDCIVDFVCDLFVQLKEK